MVCLSSVTSLRELEAAGRAGDMGERTDGESLRDGKKDSYKVLEIAGVRLEKKTDEGESEMETAYVRASLRQGIDAMEVVVCKDQREKVSITGEDKTIPVVREAGEGAVARAGSLSSYISCPRSPDVACDTNNA